MKTRRFVFASVFALTVLSVGYSLAAQTGPLVHLQDAHRVPVTHVGPATTLQVLNSGLAQPLALARGDFNQDGAEDLVVGYSAPGTGGILALQGRESQCLCAS